MPLSEDILIVPVIDEIAWKIYWNRKWLVQIISRATNFFQNNLPKILSVTGKKFIGQFFSKFTGVLRLCSELKWLSSIWHDKAHLETFMKKVI